MKSETNERESKRSFRGELSLSLVAMLIDKHRGVYEAWNQVSQSTGPRAQDFRGSRVELSESIGPSGIVELQGGKFMAGKDARDYYKLGSLSWLLKSTLTEPAARLAEGEWPTKLASVEIACATQGGGERESLLRKIGRQLGIQAKWDTYQWHASFTNGTPEELWFGRPGDDGVVPALVTDERTRREAMEALYDHLWRIVYTLDYIAKRFP